MRMKRVYLKTILCISILFSLISCIKKDSNLPPYKPENCEPIINSEESSVSYATIVAVGDIMVHRWQMQRALNIKDSTYDFSHSFKYVNPFLKMPILPSEIWRQPLPEKIMEETMTYMVIAAFPISMHPKQWQTN